ncbi:unnamed protein product, partial [Amoebophrya sp. A120]
PPQGEQKIRLRLDPRIFLMQTSFLKFLDSIRGPSSPPITVDDAQDGETSSTTTEADVGRRIRAALPGWTHAEKLGHMGNTRRTSAVGGHGEEWRAEKVAAILTRSVTGSYGKDGEFTSLLTEAGRQAA